jgi:hypothetical protein
MRNIAEPSQAMQGSEESRFRMKQTWMDVSNIIADAFSRLVDAMARCRVVGKLRMIHHHRSCWR